MTPIAQQLAHARQALAPIAGELAALEARLLAAHAWGMTPESLVLEAESARESEALQTLIARRLTREPVAQIIGHKEFWRDSFLVSRDVLTPRADSETMIEVLRRLLPNVLAPLRVLDLGTGSGCLLLSALREYGRATGIGVDQSEAALAIARQNATRLQLETRSEFLQSDWFQAVQGPFEVVLTNPPYIASDEIPTLDADVRVHEPLAALDGGPDGLAAYRTIFAQVSAYLAPRAYVLCEIGATQADAVRAIGEAAGLQFISTTPDLAGLPRILSFKNH